MKKHSISNTPGKLIHLRDGRALSYAEFGDLAGKPVFFFHGFPGSRLQHAPGDLIATSLGAHIITIDRPGFGLSAFQPGRTLLDWPNDVAALADALEIDQFAAIGLSGGGPYLLACAYKIPRRLTSATVINGLGPLDQPGVNLGMDRSNRIVLGVAKRMPWWLIRLILAPAVSIVQRDPAAVSKYLPSSAPQVDKDVFARPAVQAMNHVDLLEACRNGVDGLSWELVLFTRPWGFRLADINMKMYLWQGEADTTIPLSMGKYMARTLPNCQARFIPGEGHTLMYNYWPDILALALS
ncbi:MAG TPA: alpha/beta hydrolase [Ktedonobacteraceae bacterium]|nr:alpha/beta hydrolase [Ktedonobacteraceae bacterium]